MIKWRFPINDDGEMKGFNDNGTANFRGTPLKSLAREICQNSLDASNSNEPVIVEFNLFNAKKEDIKEANYLQDVFQRCIDFSLNDEENDCRNFFINAKELISRDEIPVLRISDFNTTGLKGSYEKKDTDWTNLTKASGNSDKKGAAGGSFGIGKFATFACSELLTIFYSTYDCEEVRAYQGVSRLITFTDSNGNDTQGTGYYGEEKNTPVHEEYQLEPGFKRKDKEYGTDIYVLGYKYASEQWIDKIVASILDGFLVAINKNKLIVKIGDITISKDNLDEIINRFSKSLSSTTAEYYKVLTSEETSWETRDFEGMGDITLGILLTDDNTPSRVSLVRKSGMKIRDKDRFSTQLSFKGVMLIEGEKINSYLRKLENPEHDKWQPYRSSNVAKAESVVRGVEDLIYERITRIIKETQQDEVDAAGIGSFIPDLSDESKEDNKQEVISDEIKDIEIKEIKKKSSSKKYIENGHSENRKKIESQTHIEIGGDDEDYIHTEEREKKPSPKPSEPTHEEEGGNMEKDVLVDVELENLSYICIDKNNGKYALIFTPDITSDKGQIELYLSGETSRYPAPIKSASLILGEGKIETNQNTINNIKFIAGKELRISLEINYYDYCSLEVFANAIKE